MKRLAIVETRIWGDSVFLGLSDRAKLVFLFLLTHPHMQSFGGIRATPHGLAAELNWPVGRFRKACQELEEKQRLYCSPTAPLCWLPTYLQYNTPQKPEQMADLIQSLTWAAECSLKQSIIDKIGEVLKSNDSEYYALYREVFDKLLRTNPLPADEPAPAKSVVVPSPDVKTPAPPASKTVADLTTQPDRRPSPLPRSRAEDSQDPEFVSQPFQSEIPPRVIPLPPALNTQAFQQVWLRWLEHMEKHDEMLTRESLESLLNRLAVLSPEDAAEVIEFSIANGFGMVKEAEDDWAEKEPELLSPAGAEA